MSPREPAHPSVPRRPLRETGKRVLVAEDVHAELNQLAAEMSTGDHQATHSEVIRALLAIRRQHHGSNP